MEGLVEGKDNVKIVSISYMNQHDLPFNEKEFNELSSQGNSVSFLLVNHETIGLIAQGDQIKQTQKK